MSTRKRLKPEARLSALYHSLKPILVSIHGLRAAGLGVSTTYENLAINLSSNTRAVARCIRAFKERNPWWDDFCVVSKRTQMPAYYG
jgi:hypothetical protein